MHFSSVLSLLSVAALAGAQELGPAAVISNNPIGASYNAILPNSAKTNVRGSVRAETAPDGRGVNFQVAFTGFPDQGGPFVYHIHSAPVPTDGNCTGTLAHLDPYKRGQDTPCDSSKPETCEVGDLSGKHGKILTSAGLNTAYLDLYASTLRGIGAFFGNRSVVVHYANLTRITCANFTLINPGAGTGSTGTGAPYPVPTGNVTYPNTTATATAAPSGTPSATSGGGGGAGGPAPAGPPSPSASGSFASGPAFVGSSALLAAMAAFML